MRVLLLPLAICVISACQRSFSAKEISRCLSWARRLAHLLKQLPGDFTPYFALFASQLHKIEEVQRLTGHPQKAPQERVP